MGTVSRVHTFASGAILTAAQLNNEFDNLLTSSAINGGLDATNLGVTAGQATASKALVVDASRNLADATGSNRINNLALSGTFESTGAITASAGITSGGNIVSDTDSTDDLGTTGVRWANLFVDDVTVTNNVTIGGTLTLTGGITLNGNTTIGDSSADTLTVNSTITSNLIFTDNTYDIGASGATRPRDLFLSRNAVMGGTLGVTGLITATGGVSGALTGNVTGDVTGDLTGNVTGNVTGNLTGDVTGNISGNVTGGTISGTTGTFSGNLAVDTDTLFVDASADRVGISTASPVLPFQLNNYGGLDGNSVSLLLRNNIYYDQAQARTESIKAGYATEIYLHNDDGSIRFRTSSSPATGANEALSTTERARIDSSGNVGIGTSSPSLQTWRTNTYLTIDNGTDGGVVELVTSASDASGNEAGAILWGATGNTTNHKHIGGIEMVTEGSTATQRGAYMRLLTKADGTAQPTERLRIDANGNMGLGVAPSAWGGSFKALQVNDSVFYNDNGGAWIGSNFYNDGTSNKYINTDYSVVYGHSSGDHVFYTAPSGTAGNTPAFTERMRLTNAGSLGLGTSSPSYKTEIAAGASTEGLAVTASSGDVYLQTDGQLHGYQKLDTTSAGLQIKGFSDGGGTKTEQAKIYLTQAATGARGGEIRFYTDNSSAMYERARIDLNGDVAIGRAPYTNYRFTVQSADSSSSTYAIQIQNSLGYGLIQARADGQIATGTYTLSPYNNTTASAANMHINSSGILQRSTSSAKYKTDVETIEDSYADAILNMRPVWYRSLSEADNANHGWWGFIAEEVADIDPRLVQYRTTESVISEESGREETVTLDEPIPEGVSYDRFVPLLLNLIQRQQQSIATLETKVAALEAA